MAPGGRFHPLAPARIADTRDGTGGVPRGPVQANGNLAIEVSGRGGIPDSGVAAVVINVTATDTTADSYLTVYPSGGSIPIASNLNWSRGKTVANLVLVAPGGDGTVSVYNAAGTADVVIDVAGWVSTSASTPGTDGKLRSLVPARIEDTRSAGAPLGPNQPLSLQVAGRGGVPPTGVEAAVLNVTATGGTSDSYLTAYPAGGSPPLASNVNFQAGTTVANRVMVKLGTGGSVTIINGAGWVHVVVDVVGWYSDSTVTSSTGNITPLRPARVFDTRDGTGVRAGPVAAQSSITVLMAGRGGVPSMTSPAPPSAVVVNVTAADATAASYLTVYPGNHTRPTASDLNWAAGQNVPNLVVAALAPDGTITLYNAAGSVDVVGDVVGWVN